VILHMPIAGIAGCPDNLTSMSMMYSAISLTQTLADSTMVLVIRESMHTLIYGNQSSAFLFQYEAYAHTHVPFSCHELWPL
jgi:hypothetical protein